MKQFAISVFLLFFHYCLAPHFGCPKDRPFLSNTNKCGSFSDICIKMSEECDFGIRACEQCPLSNFSSTILYQMIRKTYFNEDKICSQTTNERKPDQKYPTIGILLTILIIVCLKLIVSTLILLYFMCQCIKKKIGSIIAKSKEKEDSQLDSILSKLKEIKGTQVDSILKELSEFEENQKESTSEIFEEIPKSAAIIRKLREHTKARRKADHGPIGINLSTLGNEKESEKIKLTEVNGAHKKGSPAFLAIDSQLDSILSKLKEIKEARRKGGHQPSDINLLTLGTQVDSILKELSKLEENQKESTSGTFEEIPKDQTHSSMENFEKIARQFEKIF